MSREEAHVLTDIEQELRKGPGIFHLFSNELKMVSRYRLQNDATGVQP
jgi:hypothetical protein